MGTHQSPEHAQIISSRRHQGKAPTSLRREAREQRQKGWSREGQLGFRDGLRSGRLAHGPKRSTLRGLNNQLDNGTGPSSLVAPVDDATLWMTATLRFQARPPNDN